MTESIKTVPAELKGTVKLTYEEFQKIPYDGLGHHLLSGVHIITPAPSLLHQKVSANLHLALLSFIKENKLGEVYAAPIDVKFSEDDGYQPDLIFLSIQDLPKKTKNYVYGAPSLIIEILSPDSGKSDYGWKKNLAEKYKVAEYWIVDPGNKIIELFRLQKDKYSLFSQFNENDIVKSSLEVLKGLSIPVKDIFNE